MREIVLKRDGTIPKKMLDYLGGKFNFLDRLRLNGIGSPKLTYEKGHELLDTMQRNIGGESTILNIELMKAGIIIRAYAGQRIKLIGINFSDLQRLQLITFPIKISETKTKNAGRLTIEGDKTITASVSHQNVKDTLQFLSKSIFKDHFVHESK